MLTMILILDAVLLLMTFIFAMTPYITRRTESFGVAIPAVEYGSGVLVRMRRSYAVLTALVGIAGTFVVNAMVYTFGEQSLAFAGGIFAILVVFFFIYYSFHRKMKAYKQNAPWRDHVNSHIFVALAEETGEKRPASGKWFLLYFVVIAITVGVTVWIYPSLPGQIPIHYDFYGNVTDYAQKSMVSALFLPGMQVFMAALFGFVYMITLKAKRVIDADDAQESMRRQAAYRAAWANFSIFGGLLLVLFFSVIHFSTLGLLPLSAAMAGTILMTAALLIWAVVLAIRYGQGGALLGQGVQTGSQMSMREDDRYWKAGVFYFNKEDPSLFVEKRFGVGFTSNFAKPLTWVFIGLMLVGIAGVILFAAKLI